MLSPFEINLTENGLEPEVGQGLYEIINYSQRVLNSFTIQDFEQLDKYFTFLRTPQGMLTVASCQQQLQFFLNQNPAFRATTKEKICIKMRHFFKARVINKPHQQIPQPAWVDYPSAQCSQDFDMQDHYHSHPDSRIERI
ncbi:hypothetical protein TRFO_05445 [Tritrichomonas foetus]|uniref:Uncharacterized protein n=1 Tax=Tritrichomonas foetus TaxID=1144522 RepID=A0A1J4K706_9EUKA|nr:hypothetical protein TRFO_05445 [Tritrichomonas foetus]|eukprot:OHT06762.1 hypothetical protein TRFO_05445 [Tritrichomonas foetus]